MSRKTTLMKAILIVALATCVTSAHADEATVGTIIDKAGLQRMLTQRIVKSYCQIGTGVFADEARSQLHGSINQFESQLKDLQAFVSGGLAAESLDTVDRIWQDFRRQATGPVDREHAIKLAWLGEDLLYASHKVVQILQDNYGSTYARLVNISGRQRMLSQRLAQYHLMRHWGLNSISISDEISKAANEFDGALKILQSASVNTSGIASEIEHVELQWQWFRTALSLEGAHASAQIVVEASESVLDGMDRITKLYATIADGE